MCRLVTQGRRCPPPKLVTSEFFTFVPFRPVNLLLSFQIFLRAAQQSEKNQRFPVSFSNTLANAKVCFCCAAARTARNNFAFPASDLCLRADCQAAAAAPAAAAQNQPPPATDPGQCVSLSALSLLACSYPPLSL